MKMTAWGKDTGREESQIGRHHQRLMQIFHQIEEHQHDDVRSEAISLIIDQLREVASHYFRYEEEYMVRVGYPGYQAHEEQHKQFRKKIAALCVDVMNHKETAPQDIYRYLSEWVEKHLLDSDKQMQTFMDIQQVHNE